ncbi:MAG: dimethyl sulfoxide reductase anchor subunit [Candidatus Omnitrophica bacterium]|nr:dimethyl sulfoxide reductase anchor subunit [Candidatus Omnitrophota bacterium]
MSDFNLVDILDAQNLPLKNRIGEEGYYQPVALIPTEPLEEGEQYRFHFDMTRCVGCQCCVVACNEQNNNPAEVNWRRVGEIEGGIYPATKRYHLSMACNHCLDPSCLTGCPTDAYIKLDNGVVKHQAEECIGCGYCSWNCPYGVPQYNPERNIVTKCDMCHSRLKDGELPACVAACPESAIQIEKVNVNEWRKNHLQADAPYIADSGLTISTTRITLPENAPENLLRANRHRIEPEKPHTSLIFMTVLTQLAVGGFMTLWLAEFFSNWLSFLKPLHDFLPYGAAGMLVVTGLALFAAVFHLGRPLYAYKALRMWKRSWLSREVLLFAIFSHLGGMYAVLQLVKNFWHWNIPEGGMLFLGALVVLSGLAGVYASAKIYLVPARPAWNTIRTPLRFFLTGFMLGPLFALSVYGIYSCFQTQEVINNILKAPSFTFLAVSTLAGFLQLVVLLARLFALPGTASEEQMASNFLLVHRFKKYFLGRLALLVLGSFVIPFILYSFLQVGHLKGLEFLALGLACFIFSLAGEFLGRYLFFVTVVPKNMPGAFFTAKAGAH